MKLLLTLLFLCYSYALFAQDSISKPKTGKVLVYVSESKVKMILDSTTAISENQLLTLDSGIHSILFTKKYHVSINRSFRIYEDSIIRIRQRMKRREYGKELTKHRFISAGIILLPLTSGILISHIANKYYDKAQSNLIEYDSSINPLEIIEIKAKYNENKKQYNLYNAAKISSFALSGLGVLTSILIYKSHYKKLENKQSRVNFMLNTPTSFSLTYTLK